MTIAGTGKWLLSVKLIETSLKTTEKRYELTSADYAAAVIDAASVITKLEAVSDLEVVEYHFYEEHVEDTIVIPTAAQKENQALLSLRIAGNPLKNVTHAIPGASAGIFIAATGPDSDRVDTADTQLVAYAGMFMSGGECYISDGETADNLNGGHRRHVANSNG